MAWFPSDPNWNDFYPPAGTEQELQDLESIFRDIPQPTNHTHAKTTYSQSYLPMVDSTTLDTHSLIAPSANHHPGLGNQPMMSRDSSQPWSMPPVPHAEQPFEQSVNPKLIPKSRKPRGDRKSPELQGSRSTPLRCGWKDCSYTGTFARKAELMRHIDVLHVSPHSYDCPVRGCRKVCNRWDNLWEHIRRAH
ncbi:hypothetical protein BDV36DRAFT_293411 [Aspergillus pseudocaelatus]|uniref:C2H2-type domain-containing protein n=1 Tax=Aspergillus pseudocaelatus TaxID=1825620 RepID=A0ABQ6WT82_9EURO|nr:hypothetical protein BDV36DRAFT_293411 [Aspergillus pseudocaelatus]